MAGDGAKASDRRRRSSFRMRVNKALQNFLRVFSASPRSNALTNRTWHSLTRRSKCKVENGLVRYGNKWISPHTFLQIQVCSV